MQAHTSTWPEYFIPLVAITAAVIAVSIPPGLALLAVELGATALLVQYRWPQGAGLALVLAAAMSGFVVNIAGLNIRPEQLVVLVVLLVAVARGGIGTWDWPDKLLAAFVLVNLLSSLVASPAKGQSVRHTALLLLAVVPYWLVRRLAKGDDGMFRSFLMVGVGAAAFGTLCYISHYLFGTEVGIMLYPASALRNELAGVKGSHLEANIYGSYVASFAAIFFSLYFSGGKRVHLLGCLACSIATAVSLARAAWLGLAVAFGVTALFRLSWRQIKKLIAMALVTTAVGSILFYSIDSLRERTASLAPTAVLEDETLVSRAYYASIAIDNIRLRPWLGWGTDSFELMQEWETFRGTEGAWLGNLPVRVMHDTGVIGAALLFGFFAIMLWRAGRSRNPVAKALMAGSIVLAIAFQFTDATTLVYPWVLLGLLTIATGQAGPNGFRQTSHQRTVC